ncbi:TatD family hydrolase [Faecalicatena contorta]|uniref:TatD family hydrolase n=1 Tax=Faecalicatena contorta TaxID=39482 RepID=UPI001F2C859E|nr:TatD family hydrolase [Faecalicatena contorta]MCF2683283.1 TatD family hydrolase [Faecalicatena contorta]
MIFDTHAHYDSEQFNEDRKELLQSMEEQGVGTIVNVCASYASCERVTNMVQEYPFMYAAVGIHPDHVGSLNEETFARMKELFTRDKVIAVGEIGLDYYWDHESHDLQKNWFIRQLELAKELDLPVLIHSRDAAADTMEIMREYAAGLDGVIHCYSYSREMAQEYVKMGFYIGVGGVVTFKNGRKLKETVADIPLEAIVLETDCPYLAPEPYRGKRNNSSYIRYVAEEIARIKGVTYEEVVAQTEENARKMYRL